MSYSHALLPQLYFSYSQFAVCDKAAATEVCEWTEGHTCQGFARRDCAASFGTLLEFGLADVSVFHAPYRSQKLYDRVIAVPFRAVSGVVFVVGPEEPIDSRAVAVANGDYRLVVAQSITGEEKESVDLYFELHDRPLSRSEIIVADAALRPPISLIECARLVGEI